MPELCTKLYMPELCTKLYARTVYKIICQNCVQNYKPELYTKHLFAVGQYLCYNIRINML